MSAVHVTPRTVPQSITDAYRHLLLAGNHLTHLRTRPDADPWTRETAAEVESIVSQARSIMRLAHERVTATKEGSAP